MKKEDIKLKNRDTGDIWFSEEHRKKHEEWEKKQKQ